MTDSESASTTSAETPIDEAYRATQAGSHEGFTAWVRLVEMPLRVSLRSFARDVDLEAIIQEVLMRMWRWAPDRELEGTNASLRYALVVARNMALAEMRKLRRVDVLDDPGPVRVILPPIPDLGLRAAIVQCLDLLKGKPREALRARVEHGGVMSDKMIASSLAMTINTFLQNIVRARAAVKECLRRAGYPIEEHLP